MKKILSGLAFSLFLFSCSNGEKKEAATEPPMTAPATAEAEKKPADVELLDMSMAEPVKKGMIAFTNKDVDGMTALYADNVRYTWSSGDSLIGKQAVKDYYSGRIKLIDSISYSDFIFLPIKANVSQSQYAPTGKWMLDWAFAHVKYKNGKKINFWLHQVNHYNDAGMIDYVGQYIDRGQIAAATMGMAMPKPPAKEKAMPMPKAPAKKK